jgi:hypothetical protein
MKMKTEHKVPLSLRCVEILELAKHSFLLLLVIGATGMPVSKVEITKHHVDLLTRIFTSVRSVGIGSSDAVFK